MNPIVEAKACVENKDKPWHEVVAAALALLGAGYRLSFWYDRPLDAIVLRVQNTIATAQHVWSREETQRILEIGYMQDELFHLAFEVLRVCQDNPMEMLDYAHEEWLHEYHRREL